MGSVAYLVEPVLATVTDVHHLDNLGRQPLVEHVTQTQLSLEIRTTRQHETCHVDLVVRDEVLDRQLSNLTDVVVTLLITKTSETKCGLSTTAVLLGKIDGELVNDLTRVACDSTEERAVTVHDDETELRVRLEELLERFRVELVVTEVQRPVQGFAR